MKKWTDGSSHSPSFACLKIGCGGGNGTTAFAPTESSLYVTKEGTVTSADVESYENDYYSADELKAYAEEMLGVFESGNQSGSSVKKG